MRSTRVLIKTPMSFSVSTRFRPATGVPTHDIVLTRVAAQQYLECRQQRHEQGDAFPTAKSLEGIGHRLGQEDGLPRALESLDRRAPPVGGKFQCFRSTG